MKINDIETISITVGSLEYLVQKLLAAGTKTLNPEQRKFVDMILDKSAQWANMAPDVFGKERIDAVCVTCSKPCFPSGFCESCNAKPIGMQEMGKILQFLVEGDQALKEPA